MNTNSINKDKSTSASSKNQKSKKNIKKKILKSLSHKNVLFSLNSNSALKNYDLPSFRKFKKLKSLNTNSLKTLQISNHENNLKPKLQEISLTKKLISDIKKNKNLSFFITDQSGLKVNRRVFRKRIHLKKLSSFGQFLNYNVFNEKDAEIKDLIDKFNKQMEKKKMNKMERRKNILNKLYGITPKYNKILKNSKSQKKLSLEEYQDNILLAFNSNGNYNIETIGQLYQKFKNIKTDVENVVPYPKINIKNIVSHFKKGIKRESDKKMRIKDFISKSNEPQDEFEKDERKIISLRFKKINNHMSKIQNDNLFVLPIHIRKLFIK